MFVSALPRQIFLSLGGTWVAIGRRRQPFRFCVSSDSLEMTSAWRSSCVWGTWTQGGFQCCASRVDLVESRSQGASAEGAFP